MVDLALAHLRSMILTPQFAPDARIYVICRPPFTPVTDSMDLLAERTGLGYLNMTQVLRRQVAARSPYGLAIQAYDAAQQDPPAELIAIGALIELGQPQYRNGALLEGFPLTPSEADHLPPELAFKALLELSATDDDLVVRAGERRKCNNCGKVYGWHRKPAERPLSCSCFCLLMPLRTKTPPDREVQHFRHLTTALAEHCAPKGATRMAISAGNEVTEDDVVAALLNAISPSPTEPSVEAN